jgi:hypothetical protein
MKSFKSFLRESEEIQGIHALFHPVRGMYKVHKSGEFHHVKNNEGEVTHTFVGKTDDEVLNILKQEHDLIYAGKIHEDYIAELRAPKPVLSAEHIAHDKDYAKASASINDARGRYNEAMVLQHLNGNKWINPEHKKLATEQGKILSDHDKEWNDKAKKIKHPSFNSQEKKAQEDRAPEQAKAFLQHAKEQGYEEVAEVHHTSKEGDIEKATGLKVSQQDNSSDGVVKFKKKPANNPHNFLGASLKSSSKKEIGFHNGGTKEIGQLIGHDLLGHANAEHEKFMKKHGLGDPKLNKNGVKVYNKAKASSQVAGEKYLDEKKKIKNPQYRNNINYNVAKDNAKKINSEIRDKLHEGYSQMKHEDLKKHLLNTYIKGNDAHALPYLKVTGTGGGSSKKPASAHSTDPSDNDLYHQIKNAHGFHLEKGKGKDDEEGGSGMTVHTIDKDGNKKRAFRIQVKHGNGPLTSVKILGQP